MTSFSYGPQRVSGIAADASLITSFPTMLDQQFVSEPHISSCERQSHDIFSGSLTNSKQWVTLHIPWKLVSRHLFLWPTACEWHCTFVKGGHITSSPMTNSLWMTFMDILWKAVSWHLFLWQTGSEWHCTFCERQSSHHIFSYNSEWVVLHILWKAASSLLWSTVCEWHSAYLVTTSSLIIWLTGSEWPHFVRGSLMTSFPTYDHQLVSDIA